VSSAVKLSEKSRQLLGRYLQLKIQLEQERERELQALLALRELALQLLQQVEEEIRRMRARRFPAVPQPTAQPPSGSAAGQQRRGFAAEV
jgi:hypothetical protein